MVLLISTFFLFFSPLSLIFYYLFLLHVHRPHRDLQSFPTRRSSDLTALTQFLLSISPRNFPAQPQKSTWNISWKIRSEEHTSELQSRFDLVCRLLLEKKNLFLLLTLPLLLYYISHNKVQHLTSITKV